MGNFSSTLLILRAADLLTGDGRSNVHAAAIAVLLYAGLNAANALVAYPAGAIADRIGRRPVIITGIIAFGAACVDFAFSSANIPILATIFAVVGASSGMVETAQSAYAAQVVEEITYGGGHSASLDSSRASVTSSRAWPWESCSPCPPQAGHSLSVPPQPQPGRLCYSYPSGGPRTYRSWRDPLRRSRNY